MTTRRRNASAAFMRRGATTMWRRAWTRQVAIARVCSNNLGGWAARAARRSARWKRFESNLRSIPCVRYHAKYMVIPQRCPHTPWSIFPASIHASDHSPNTVGRSHMPTRDEPVYIRVEDEHILGTLISPGTLVPGVLFVHGWGGDQRQYVARARELTALGCVCLTFDLRGHAQTQAQYDSVSREDNMRDLLAAYDFLAALRNVDSDSIAVVGSSYGGYLAALLTALRPVKWLALRVPPVYKDSERRVAQTQPKREEAPQKQLAAAGKSPQNKTVGRLRRNHGEPPV